MARYRRMIAACVVVMAVALDGLMPTPNSVGRRTFVIGTGILSSHFGEKQQAANADPRNAFLPAGSGGVMQPMVVEQILGWQDPTNSFVTNLGKTRLGRNVNLSPLQQAPFSSQELYYPQFMFGSWEVTATLERKVFPFGNDFVPNKLLVSEKTGDTTTFPLHYFSTLADTLANQVTVNLGLGVPQSKIIADRGFNIVSLGRAYQPTAKSPTVDWDYRDDPTRLSLRYAEPTSDPRQQGQQRVEIYLNARETELSEDGLVFGAAERSRSVVVGPGRVDAVDQEGVTEFRKVDDETIEAQSRIAMYLTPNPNSREGILWQQVGGKAVALYDYGWKMKRKQEEFKLEDGSTVLKPCVTTPKDVTQCW